MTGEDRHDEAFEFLINFLWRTFGLYVSDDDLIRIDEHRFVFKHHIKTENVRVSAEVAISFEGYITIDVSSLLTNPIRQTIWQSKSFKKVVLNKLAKRFPGELDSGFKSNTEFRNHCIVIPIVTRNARDIIVTKNVRDIIDSTIKIIYLELEKLEKMIVDTLIDNPELVDMLIMYEKATEISKEIKS